MSWPDRSEHKLDGGYWGEATTTLLWCERKYEWSKYVAEPVNTVRKRQSAAEGLSAIIIGDLCVAVHESAVFWRCYLCNVPRTYGASRESILPVLPWRGCSGLRLVLVPHDAKARSAVAR